MSSHPRILPTAGPAIGPGFIGGRQVQAQNLDAAPRMNRSNTTGTVDKIVYYLGNPCVMQMIWTPLHYDV